MVKGVRPKEFSLDTEDEAEACAKAVEILSDAATFAPASWTHEVDTYLRERGSTSHLRPRTCRVRRPVLLRFAKDIGVDRPEMARREHVQDYYRAVIDSGRSKETAKGYVTALRAFFAHLVRRRKLRVNPAVGVTMDQVKVHHRHRFCTKDEVDLLIDGCDAVNGIYREDRLDLKFILLCGFDAGLRKIEICEAIPDWFALPDIIDLRSTRHYELKDREARVVPLTARFKAFLAEYGRPAPFMLHPEVAHGESEYRWDWRQPFYEHLAKVSMATGLDLTWVKAHTLRHTFASQRVNKGISVYKVAKWLGDSVLMVERHYGHIAPQADSDIEV